MTTLDTFETQLLARLREDVGRTRPAHGSGLRRRLGAAAGALAVAAGSAFVWWPEPAWAVAGRANGDVEVTIRSFSDVDGLRRALAAEGVAAVITQASAYDPSTAEPAESPACAAISGFAARIGGGEATYRIPAAGIATGAVLHIVHGGDLGSADRGTTSWISVWWEGGPCR